MRYITHFGFIKFLILAIFCNGCNQRKNETNSGRPIEDTLHLVKLQKNLLVLNPQKYSEDFIYQLELGAMNDSATNKLQLLDSLIIYKNDTLFWPNQIDSGRTYCFKGRDLRNRYQLKLKRINLTDIEYEYLINEKPDPYHYGKGTMSLELYSLINRKITFDSVQEDAKDFLKYSDNITDGYFYIFVERNHSFHLHAIVSKGYSRIQPPLAERTPVLGECETK